VYYIGVILIDFGIQGNQVLNQTRIYAVITWTYGRIRIRIKIK